MIARCTACRSWRGCPRARRAASLRSETVASSPRKRGSSGVWTKTLGSRLRGNDNRYDLPQTRQAAIKHGCVIPAKAGIHFRLDSVDDECVSPACWHLACCGQRDALRRSEADADVREQEAKPRSDRRQPRHPGRARARPGIQCLLADDTGFPLAWERRNRVKPR